MLIRLNPLLRVIADADGFFNAFMESGLQVSCNTLEGQISIYWYIGTVLSFMIYGVILDCFKWGMKYLRSHRK